MKNAFEVLREVALTTEGVNNRRHASMVVRGKAILGMGVNRYKTDPFQLKFARNSESLFLHAEVAAIKSALRHIDRLARAGSLEGCDLYVLRLDRHNKYAMSLPCKGCQKAIVEFGIRNVYYTNREGTIDRFRVG